MDFKKAQEIAAQAREDLATSGFTHDHVRVVRDDDGAYRVEARRHDSHVTWTTIAS